MKTDAVLNALQEACKGLLFISESDAELEPFQWSDVPKLDSAALSKKAGAEKNVPVECITLAQFFRAVSQEDKPQFDRLEDVLSKNLSDIKVYKVGKTEKKVFIVGKTSDGSWAGVKTTVVET